MEDKTFELMTKMYAEMKQGFAAVDKRFNTVESDIKCLKDDVGGLKKSVMNLENDLKPKVEAALDGYKMVYEKLQDHDKRFDNIEQKVDNLTLRVTKHAGEIKNLKSVK
jgi:chromosome segregation ATPase